MDVLADVLAATKVGGVVAARVDAAAPWGIAFPAMPMAAFHTVTGGTCWLRCPDAEPVQLSAGDIALLPAGRAHALSSDPAGPLIPYEDVLARRAGGPEQQVRLPGPGPRTRLLCGGYRFDGHVAHPALNLPPVLHLPADAMASHRDLTETLRMLTAELADPRPGSQTIADRLTDVLFVHILRAWAGMRQDSRASWLTALHDPQVAMAVSLMHEDPARPWTVQELARHAGVSRATLSRRFRHLVGEPPMAYLTRWRLELAARRLRDTADPLTAIARSLGYESAFAFSRAFTRHCGIAPSRYRAGHRSA